MPKSRGKRPWKAPKPAKQKEDLSLSQSQSEFLYTLVRCQNNTGEGVTTGKLAEGMRVLGHSSYTEDSSMIPRLVHQLRKVKKIPIVNLPAELPDGQVTRGYGLENYLLVTLPRTSNFLMQFRAFPNDEEGGRPAEKDLNKFKEHLLSNGFSPEMIEDDIKFTLNQNYLMAFPNDTEPSHLRARNRLAHELRYLRLLAKSPNASQRTSPNSAFSLGKKVHTLSESEALVLFTVWDMEQKNGQPPTFEAIQQELKLTANKLEESFHRLERFRWDVLTSFGDRTYRLVFNKIVGWPRTAAALVLLREGRYREPDGLPFQLSRQGFVDFASGPKELDAAPHDLHADLTYLAKNKYIKFVDDQKEFFWPDDRLYAEFPYLKLVATQYHPKKAMLEALLTTHSSLLMALWESEGWAERKYTLDESKRPVTSFSALSEVLSRQAESDYSEAQVKRVLQEIFTYQSEHRNLWPPIVQYDSDDPEARTGVKFCRFSLVTYPETAALILHLSKQSNQHEAFIEKQFPHFDRDMGFFERTGYIKRTASDWQVTPRAKAEQFYLEAVATRYLPKGSKHS